jgi:predicted helicase
MKGGETMVTLNKSPLEALYAGRSPQEAGRLFERLVRKILKELHPIWSQEFVDVVPWSEHAARKGLRATDIGVDLVGYGKDGKVYAIQVKLWDKPLSWRDLGSFVGVVKHPEYGFDHGLIVAPRGVTQEAERQLQGLPITILSEEALLEDLDLESLAPDRPEEARRRGKKALRKYQQEALEEVAEAFQEKGLPRGKLIMPPGTGKTLVALKIAEKVAGPGGRVLFLAPSIALLDQSLRAWAAEASIPLRLFAVVSDTGVGKTSEDDLSALSLLSIPPTTKPEELASEAKTESQEALTVVFSTYQSVEVLERAQKDHGLPPFDLMILDEAHRTATVRAGEESPFTKVHHDHYVKARHRLYMTATPRIWEVEGNGEGDQGKKAGKKKGPQKEASLPLLDLSASPAEDSTAPEGVELLVYSMDNEEVYGPTLYEYTFTRAVKEGHLSDYKVIVFSVAEEAQRDLASYLQGPEALKVEEALKALGLWKVLQGEVRDEEGKPMEGLDLRRVIAFHGRVAESKRMEEEFAKVALAAQQAGLLPEELRRVEVRHIDGQMSAYDRKRLLDWLRENVPEGEVRLLTNAKVLTEGIDVPALDAVAFMRPRDSVVDVIQAVGRVMRKAPGKEYGYVVLPVVVRGQDEEREIEESGYRAVWQVLSAVRSVDKSFEARMRAALVRLSGKGEGGGGGEAREGVAVIGEGSASPVVMDVLLEDPDLRQKVTRGLAGKLVKRLALGRKYLENWAQDVARVARVLEQQVRAMAERDPKVKEKLGKLLAALRAFTNESVTEDEAILMLVQHALTKPIFDALFGELLKEREDPVSRALDELFQEFRGFLDREGEALKDFYEEMRLKALGLTDEAERADFLRRLYSNFFTRAFPQVADQVGIAYTPVELVDFLVRSADELARKHFGRGLDGEKVFVLEPFAGTGTFVTRILHRVAERGGAEAVKGKLERGEIWANEILLLPYYVLRANVENTALALTGEYVPFKGALLADSFRLAELWYSKGEFGLIPLFPEEYGEALNEQLKAPIQVILSNPPWRAGVEKEGEGKKNPVYRKVRERVEATYIKRAKEISIGAKKKGELFNSLYDQYIQALRVASDRIGEEGVVGFVTNNGWLEGVVARGLRASLAEEFAEVYVYDLRGNAREKGEAWKKEGDKVFGQASRAGVCLLLLVKRKDHKGIGKVHLYRVGDGLSREAKLALVNGHGSVSGVPWQEVPYEDWVGRLTPGFSGMLPLDEVFEVRSRGVATSRDAYAFNPSRAELERHMSRLISTYNEHVRRKKEGKLGELEKDESLIKWDRELIRYLESMREASFEGSGQVYEALYRPFVPMYLYLSRTFNSMVYQLPRIWPTPEVENLAIAVAGKGSNAFSAVATRRVVDLHFLETTQLYPLYHYPENGPLGGLLERKLNLKEEFLRKLGEVLGRPVSPGEAFAYIYAVVSPPLYAERFAKDLKMDLPRVPLPQDPELFAELVEGGLELIRLHTDYETLPPWSPVPLQVKEEEKAPKDPYERYRVERMKLGKERGVLQYNDWVRVEGIPEEAFRWRPGGYSPLEWMVRFWKVEEKVPKGKGEAIVWDPNLFLKEKGDPRYLLDLIGRAVQVAVRTVGIHEELREDVEALLG